MPVSRLMISQKIFENAQLMEENSMEEMEEAEDFVEDNENRGNTIEVIIHLTYINLKQFDLRCCIDTQTKIDNY